MHGISTLRALVILIQLLNLLNIYLGHILLGSKSDVGIYYKSWAACDFLASRYVLQDGYLPLYLHTYVYIYYDCVCVCVMVCDRMCVCVCVRACVHANA